MEMFHSYSVQHLTHSFSDHCPILCDTLGKFCESKSSRERRFMFEANWCLDQSFARVVQQAWVGHNGNVVDKLAQAGQIFKKWSLTQSREQRKERSKMEKRLSYLYDQVPTDENLEEILEVQLGLNLEADKDEVFWEQRAKINWLKHGDRNTGFFHRSASSRHKRNRIVGLESAEGRWISQPDAMLKEAVTFFGELYTASDLSGEHRLLDLVEKRVTPDMNGELLKPFLEDEIWQAVKSMAPIKAPGIDGFPALFFQKYWNVVGNDITYYCLAVLKGDIEMGEINKTHIVLIPKVDRPKTLSQFRPISLCNMIYKIIAKVMVNRMSLILGQCIDVAQGAFIPGRQISDNTLIAYEILHSLKSRKHCKQSHFALKLDMSKAYDRVEWDFLAGMLSKMGFCQDWIILVMRCVCSVSYTVGINESISEVFFPSRGLRQGDPLSPFLFLICAEGLSTLLKEAKNKGSMIGAPIGRERFSINHLLFADDCILFGDASETGANAVRSILKEYSEASGQQVNYDKSLIYFGASVDQNVREQITNTLGVRVSVNPEKYLGLPMMVGRRKRWAFANFVDRFRKRIESWSFRFLSMGGKEVFIKAILQAIPIYVMQCFELPKSLCNALEKIMNKYWWVNGKTGKGIHWSSWKDLCYPKIVGGLGFRDLYFFNKALLAKQAWRLFAQPDCLLAKVLKARYYPKTNFLSAKVGSYPSFTWRSICGARELIAAGLCWRIGNGKSINIWNDPWVPGTGQSCLSVQNMNIHWQTVNQLIDEQSFTWKKDIIHKLVDCDKAKRILNIPLARSDEEDLLVWRHDNTGVYSVKSGSAPEDSEHLLWYCEVLRTIWNLLDLYVDLDGDPSEDNKLVRMFIIVTDEKRKLLTISFWAIWYMRNKMVHEGCKFSLDEIVCFIRRYVYELNLSCTSNLLSISKNTAFWKPPLPGIIKLNFDASFVNATNSAIVGVVGRNDRGLIMGACTYQINDAADAFVAESRACERAILFAIDMGFRKIMVEGDSLTVIKKIRAELDDRSVIRPIIRNIRMLAKGFEQISFSFIPRKGNRVAHTLAAEGHRWPLPCYWVEEVPECVNHIVEADWTEWLREHE
ncbi:reverse transcriptase [Gossypium australe]|uniref:Reverse transcriptase n=1 Tax=Gossypium australe TaxID=47621 RepID=A0A5B6VSY9_9ROSI|nr:reverse transcriptase [Gossypium australe]